MQHKNGKKSKIKNEANFLGNNADSDQDYVNIFWLLENCAEYCLDSDRNGTGTKAFPKAEGREWS
jgi:hypothetical protein